MKILILFTSVCLTNFANAGLSFEDFLEVKQALYETFEELKPNIDHNLDINKKIEGHDNYWWDLDAVYASYSSYENLGVVNHNIFLFGGFIRLQEMTKDGLILTGCHELGHGIGGTPKKESGSTSEGQADYFSTKVCLKTAFKYLKASEDLPKDKYINEFCEKNSSDYHFCLRAFGALKSDIYFFKTLGDNTSFDQASPNLALEINRSSSYYPDAQCRIDTMIHGIIDLERPKCWYPDGIERKL